jgi:hypothetical protein
MVIVCCTWAMIKISGPSQFGTIWIPLIGARGYASVETPGVAETVKAVALIVNTT